MFKKVKEIRSKSGELHFVRWNIFSIGNFSVNIHAIYKADEDKHLHNHPWNFVSIVLKGWYSEKLEGDKTNIRYPRNIVKRKKDAFHKIDSLHSKVIYTLNCMWGKRDDWGYMVNGKFVQHEKYRMLKNEGLL